MKTRAEIEAELASKEDMTAKKIALEKEKEELKSLLNAFLDKLRAFKVQKEVKFSLSDFNEINALKKQIQELNIPAEVKIKQEVHHTTDKVSHKFLWWYFFVSFGITTLVTSYAIYQHFSIEEKLKVERKKAYDEGFRQMFDVLPKKTKKYIREKYGKKK